MILIFEIKFQMVEHSSLGPANEYGIFNFEK